MNMYCFMVHTCTYTIYTGPSIPQNVVARVTSSPEVHITWSPPALPRGVITLYKVYAEPVDASMNIVNAVDLPVPVSQVCVL